MSDATERPAVDDDAWAEACAEDLEAEKARRRAAVRAAARLRRRGAAQARSTRSPTRSPRSRRSLPGMAAQSAVQQLVNQAKSAVEPVIERNPDVFDHLAGGGQRTARRLPIRRRGPGATLDPGAGRRRPTTDPATKGRRPHGPA